MRKSRIVIALLILVVIAGVITAIVLVAPKSSTQESPPNSNPVFSQPGTDQSGSDTQQPGATTLMTSAPAAAASSIGTALIKQADTVVLTSAQLRPQQTSLLTTFTTATPLPAFPLDTPELGGQLDRLQVKRVIAIGDAPEQTWRDAAGQRELIMAPAVPGAAAQPTPAPQPATTAAISPAAITSTSTPATSPPSATATASTEITAADQQLIEQASAQLRTQIGPVTTTPTDTKRPVILISREQSHPYAAALSTARAGKATVDLLDVADPRQRTALFRTPAPDAAPILALGPDFGNQANFDAEIHMAKTAPELPGGGTMVFPGRRMIAAYGHPDNSGLGILGRQNAPATVVRINKLVDEYAKLLPGQTILPAFEIIITVAHNDTPDGTYSTRHPSSKIQPWIDTIVKAGGYAVIDLQPGRQDFLTQAKMYEDLLKQPNVGLALDPEWRLKPNQRHLDQIGSVDAAEVNRVSDWLAGVVRENNLPQKVLTLHQFSRTMYSNRETLNTNHPELAFVLHADGQGSQPAKQGTWKMLRENLPPHIYMGWKNFYTKDTPMLTAAQTVDQVHPTPWFVSYQ